MNANISCHVQYLVSKTKSRVKFAAWNQALSNRANILCRRRTRWQLPPPNSLDLTPYQNSLLTLAISDKISISNVKLIWLPDRFVQSCRWYPTPLTVSEMSPQSPEILLRFLKRWVQVCRNLKFFDGSGNAMVFAAIVHGSDLEIDPFLFYHGGYSGKR